MDIQPTSIKHRKTFDLIQKNEVERRDSKDNNIRFNQSNIFEFFYFCLIFLLSISFFIDIFVSFYFYHNKQDGKTYDSYRAIFFIRIIMDSIFICPVLIFIRFALNNNMSNYIFGTLIFLPQLTLGLISIIKINKLDNSQYSELKISMIFNFIIYILTILLTYVKLINDY